MKRILIAVAVLAISSFTASAQTKGTSMIGFGISSQKVKYEYVAPGWQDSENKTNNFSLSYGVFVKDNSKIELTGTYGKSSQEYSSTNSYETKSYGGSLSYQHYYPLLKKFYAFAGGRGTYSYSKNEQVDGSARPTTYKGNLYGVGAYGGATYFLSNRFAFEAQLLSASFYYEKVNQGGPQTSTKRTSFDVSTSGAINDLSFKIYFMF